MKTVFYKAAEVVGQPYFTLYSNEDIAFLMEWFPEMKYWIFDYNHKILLLLLADLIWKDEMEINKNILSK